MWKLRSIAAALLVPFATVRFFASFSRRTTVVQVLYSVTLFHFYGLSVSPFVSLVLERRLT